MGALDGVPEVRNPTAKQLAADRAYLRPLDRDEQERFLWALALSEQGRALHVYIALFETWMRKGALAAMTPAGSTSAGADPHPRSAQHRRRSADLEIDLTPRAAEALRAEMGEVVDLDGRSSAPSTTAPSSAHAAIAGLDPKGLTAHHVTRRTAATLAGEKPGASLAATEGSRRVAHSAVVDLYMKPSVEAARKVTR
jgi:hypothetical protein